MESPKLQLLAEKTRAHRGGEGLAEQLKTRDSNLRGGTSRPGLARLALGIERVLRFWYLDRPRG